MSTNCIRCVQNKRTGPDLLCDACRAMKGETARSDLTTSQTHCRACCCAHSWAALGIIEYTGKSIPEHIVELRAHLQEAEAEKKRLLDAYNNIRDFAEANGLNTAASNLPSVGDVPYVRSIDSEPPKQKASE